ncbi:MAG: MFS transporter [Planctomycetes bacterium]|nr:MFS transporter [Planctomycetota bacterium]
MLRLFAVNALLPATIAGLLVTGMGLALLGSVKMPLARKLKIDEVRVGGLVSLFGFVMIPVILTAGMLTDLLGRQAVLVGGGVLMIVALIVLARARSYGGALLAVLLLSAAWSAQINVINVLTPSAFAFTENKAQALNLGNVFFGMGAFLTPMGIAVVLKRKGLTTALLVLAAVVFLSVMLTTTADFSVLREGDAKTGNADSTTSGFSELLSDPVMWLCAMMLFFYGPIESAVAAWATTFLNEKGVGETAASGLLSGFWLAFMLSRLIAAFTLPAGWEAESILVLGIACVAVLLTVSLCRRKSIAVFSVIAAGFAFGPVFPTIMAILLGQIDSALHGRAVGVLFAIGGIGWTTVPMLIGAYARRSSVQRAFLIAVASAIGLCIVTGVMVSGVLS